MRSIFLLQLLFSLLVAQTLQARSSGLEKATPTVLLYADYGLTTHKSEFVNSNDTGSTLSYTLGFHAGSERTIGILLRNDSSSMSFELNESSMASVNQDVIIRYRMGPLFLGASVASSSLTATRAEETTDSEIEANGSGYGGNMAMVLDGRMSAWYLDVNYVTYGETKEVNQLDMEFSTRMDIDTGMTFYLSRDVLDLNFGYKQRTAGYSAGGTGLTDTITSTYLGLRFGFSF